MQPYRLEFELKGLTKMSNQLLRGTWRSHHGHADNWKRKVWKAVWPFRPPQPLPKAKLTLTRVSSVEPDEDGLISGFKPIKDGLVECGIIISDKRSCITSDHRWEYGKRGQGKIKVVVESA